MTSYHRSFFVRLASLLIITGCVPSAFSATVTSIPVADTFVTPGSDGSLSNNNYGASGVMGTSASGRPQGEFQSVLRFDTAAAKAAFDAQFGVGMWTIQSVTLQLTAAPPNNGILNSPNAGNFAISWMQNDSWAE